MRTTPQGNNLEPGQGYHPESDEDSSSLASSGVPGLTNGPGTTPHASLTKETARLASGPPTVKPSTSAREPDYRKSTA